MIVRRVRLFFEAVPGSIRDHLNTEEIVRIGITAATTGSGVFGLLEAMLQHVHTIFPAAADAALASALLAAVIEAMRRLQHGHPPAPEQLRSGDRNPAHGGRPRS